MSTIKRRQRRSRVAATHLLTAYAAESDETIELPEDLSTLSDEDLADLSTRAGDAFDALYESGTAEDGTVTLSPDEMAVAATLTDAIEALAGETQRREEVAAQSRRDLDALAARREAARPADESGEGEGEGDGDQGDGEGEGEGDDEGESLAGETDASQDGEGEQVLTAAGRRSLSINLGAANRASRRSQPKRKQTQATAPTMRDFAFAATGELGVPVDAGITHVEAGQMLQRRLQNFPAAAYAQAQRRGQHMRETHPLMTFRRQIPQEFMVDNDRSVESAERAIRAATDMRRLPSQSLTAAGWCAPSQPLYDICTTASRDGLFNLPEVGISRGGILVPRTPSFSALAQAVGFTFTEQEAIDGFYQPGVLPAARANSTAYTVGQTRTLSGRILEVTVAGTSGAAAPTAIPPVGHTFTDGTVTWRVIPRVDNVDGSKPCYEMPCPTWDDYRLEGSGLCLTADLITQRGYPEGLEWATENALIAHDHKMSMDRLNKVIAGSTYRVMTTGTVGATAPLLAAIEVRAEAIRYAGVLARNTLLEGVFPYWIRGVIRQDLSVREGIDLLDVTDSRIDGWFRSRGIIPQYVYDWQALPENAITWPATVQFVMYEAGAWIAGVDEIITLNTVYDSTQLGENKFTALFTEEAQLVAPRCGTSEVIEVPICGDGSTGTGVILECDLQPAA